MRRWGFRAAAALPCAALLLLCIVGLHEWWLISTRQIVVIPTPSPGTTLAEEVPAARLLPLIFGSGALAAVFAYALLKESRRVLIGAYLAAGLVVAVAHFRVFG